MTNFNDSCEHSTWIPHTAVFCRIFQSRFLTALIHTKYCIQINFDRSHGMHQAQRFFSLILLLALNTMNGINCGVDILCSIHWILYAYSHAHAYAQCDGVLVCLRPDFQVPLRFIKRKLQWHKHGLFMIQSKD